VVVGVDTLRADHLGCYGYHRRTSPNIDALAERSVVFENAIAAGIPTTPSFTTLLSGLHPYHTSVVTHPGRDRLPEDIRLLPQLAQDAGYVTAAVDNLVVQGSGRGSWFARGYHHYSGFLYAPFGSQSAQLTDSALSFVHGAGDRPLFLFVHYWDPHTPYGPLPPYDTMHYEAGTGPFDMDEVRAISPEYYDAFLADMQLRNPDDYSYVVAQYDGEISQVDEQIGRLVAGLESMGAWDDTIFLLVADHGECFGEGGLHFDHHGLYDAVTRIAMMLRLPDGTTGRLGALVSNEDVLPTLCEAADLPAPGYPLTGHSLLPALGGARDLPRSAVISTECTRQASVAIRTADEKLIVPITETDDGEDLPDVYGRPRNGDPLLFDLRADPAETHNLAATNPDRVSALADELNRWRAGALAGTGRPDPMTSQSLSLPYRHFVDRTRSRHGGDNDRARSHRRLN
jgi:arylsulfatase A-like enzyme